MSCGKLADSDVVVIGGGIVGSAVALGLARLGRQVTVLDGADREPRASRGNFALIWVQGKAGGDTSAYTNWTRTSSNLWSALAGMLREESGIDVAYVRPGGFRLFLSELELEAQVRRMEQIARLPGVDAPHYDVLTHADTRRMLPHLGRDVVGSIFCPQDAHVNSLRLLYAMHCGLHRNRVNYRANTAATSIRSGPDGFQIDCTEGTLRARTLVLAAGLGNATLGPMVGIHVPVRAVKGHIIVTERASPFLHHPIHTIRQTDEGSVMIGDSREEEASDDIDSTVLASMAARAVRMFPLIGMLNVVRTWAALRVMSADGLPIYQQSARCPGAFAVTSHSGITLAAAHMFELAPMIASGRLAAALTGFSAERFHVSPAS